MIDDKKIEEVIKDYVKYSSVEDEYPGTEGEAYTVRGVHISDPRYILPYEGNESLLGTANSPK